MMMNTLVAAVVARTNVRSITVCSVVAASTMLVTASQSAVLLPSTGIQAATPDHSSGLMIATNWPDSLKQKIH